MAGCAEARVGLDGRVDECMEDGWTEGWSEGWLGGGEGGWVDRRLSGSTEEGGVNRWMGGWVDRRVGMSSSVRGVHVNELCNRVGGHVLCSFKKAKLTSIWLMPSNDAMASPRCTQESPQRDETK